jgi:hypothetical protein
MSLAILSNFSNWFGNWFSSGWLLAIIVTIFLVDFIFIARPLGHFAVILMSLWLCIRLGPWGKWTIFWSIIIFLSIYTVYYCVYAILGRWVAKLFQKNAPEEKLHRIIGKVGHIRIVSGKTMFKWDDELWSIQEEHPEFHDGETVKCVTFSDGIAVVEKVQQL